MEPELPAPIATVAPVVPVAPAAPAAPSLVGPGGGLARPVAPATAEAIKPADGKPLVPAEPVAPAEPKYKVKVDGEMVEMTMAQMERYASKGKYADKATQQAKEAIKRVQQVEKEVRAREEAVRAKAKADTDAFLREHGIDPDDYAKTKLERKVEEGKMTAEQRRAAELERENKQLKAAQEDAAAERKAQQGQELTNQLQRRIETELATAAKRAGMSMNDETFYAVYESFREAYDLGLLPVDINGLQPHQADRIVEEAQSRLDTVQGRIKENVLKMSGQALEDFIGKEVADKIMANRLELIRARRGVGASPAAPPAPAQSQARPRTYLSSAEADLELKKLTGGVVR